MLAKLSSIKGTPKPKALVREKLYCSACGGEDVIPNSTFRGDRVDGILYLECSECRGDAPPHYTPEAVQALIQQAVSQALEGRDDPDHAS